MEAKVARWESRLPGSGGARSALIVDDQEPFATSLASAFRGRDYETQVVSDFEAAEAAIGARAPELIVCEIKLANRFVMDKLPDIRRLASRSRMIIATAYPSIATAVFSTRIGIDAYLPKPVNVPLILNMLESDAEAQNDDVSSEDPWPSLHRTIWEYLNNVFVASGSMSGAARRLGVDRRSLRRMLAKHPPLR